MIFRRHFLRAATSAERRLPARGARVALPLALCLCVVLPGCGDRAAGPTAQAPVEVLWDTWGVPHVFAADAADLAYGFGWVQARAHGDLVLRLYGQSRGRAAEYCGEEHLDLDRWVWTVGIPGRAAAWLEDQDPEMRSFLESFAAGFNAYAETYPEAIADDLEVVLPVPPGDLLAQTQRVVHFTFVVDPRTIAGARRELEQRGSNAWAVGPERSASGDTLLVANPHLPWSDLFTWFETHLVGAGIDAYGAALVGTPFLGIAFNPALGWTHTVNTHDGYDLFELQLAEGGYLFDGEVRSFETEEVELTVRAADGSLRGEPLSIRRSVHGPVVASQGETALALAVVGLDAPHLLRQYWDMARARNLGEFQAAIGRMQMPMFTFMYADRDGNILHHFGGETPVRSRGDWSTWSGPVPGDSSEWAWQGVHAFDELPTVLNPPTHWLQNANDPPWTTTFPRVLDADAFPAYMAPRFMHLRAQRSAAMLRDDESVTFDEAVAYKMSNRMQLADRILDDLASAVDRHGDATARRALDVLSAWDRTADADSRGAVLFKELYARMEAGGQSLRTPSPANGFARSWDPDEPLATPDALADPAAAATALSAAATAVEERHGRLDVAWGEVHRLRLGKWDLPANGGPGALGIFRVVNYRPDGDGTATAAGGDSFVSVVEFGDPVRAEVLLSYGNASQPGSPHVGDQLELFARKELREAWVSREEIEANLELRESLHRTAVETAEVLP